MQLTYSSRSSKAVSAERQRGVNAAVQASVTLQLLRIRLLRELRCPRPSASVPRV